MDNNNNNEVTKGEEKKEGDTNKRKCGCKCEQCKKCEGMKKE
jgi:hypothetical protein